ncbi:pilin biogenesis protein [Pseudoalteromonas sp. Cn5-37]|uniref:PilC/PilY family type IV pilus protein n=1 Tax=Pseudoalteromonas sp. Cn5-37 TaxID=2908886 RepID=UPI001F326BA8|nr:PilC/PilY family type IV pilus protein [Pseudoalteromonas sp. Cn5-37]MCF2915351.1 pilin biogenesis protein [Pseudoalteromonas sp. Cn5-37]|tara:strand:- start:1921 stop:5118 length:3198 start_codon:yes stop_codon:yes gene_type:complete
MEFTFRNIFALLLCSIFSSFVTAEDIELYVNKDIKLDEKPRVLLIFDTSGSMAFSSKTGKDCGQYNNGDWVVCNDSRLGVARNAMSNLITGNPDIDFGLMRFNGNDGGYILNGIGSSPESIKTSISNLPASGGTPLAETLWEAYLYITGQSVYYGEQVSESNRDSSVENKTFIRRECQQWGWYSCRKWKDVYSYTYISPFADSVAEAKRCDNSVNIIYMTDGDPSPRYVYDRWGRRYINENSDNGSDASISAIHNNYFGQPLVEGDYVYNNYLHQLAKIIHGTSNTTVDLYPSTPDIHETGRIYTIGFGSGMSDEGQELLRQTALLGGGKNLPASTPEELSKSLNQAVSDIRSENSTFTSPSFASNMVDQTRSGDAIYLAMFFPDKSTRWRGNLKKLKVSGSTIIDARNNAALDDDGLINTDAATFWDKDKAADGNSVKSGGVNAMFSDLAVDDIDDRQIFTDMGDFNYGSLSSQPSLKEIDENIPYFKVKVDELENLIRWARGVDVDNKNSSSSVRNDIFGDPLHSKPVAIDYGNGDIRILIGTNAGFLHMFKDDNVNNKVEESWAFIPSALFNILKPLRDKDSGKKYGMDGPISVYSKNESLVSDDDDSGTGIIDARKKEEVWAFAGMRRGGRNYYGFNITDPDDPKLKWTIQGGEGKFAKLGQTWSKPQVAFIRAFGDKPVLVFGGGYDENKDTGSGQDSVGNNVYIVDANNGNRLWSLLDDGNFNGKHSIAADVTLLDSDYDGYIDRIYAADTGGDIWRIDMPSDKTTDFSHHKLAELGVEADMRFFYKPLVARTMFSKVTIKGGETTRLDTPYDAIVIGSGKRTNPNDTKTSDQLFMIRDENTVTQSFKGIEPSVIKPADLMKMNDDPFGNTLDDLDGFTLVEAKLAKKKGWRYELAKGEKSLAAATVVGGVAYFTSFTPASESSTKNQCSLSGGGGALYAFHLHYGTKVYEDLKFTTSTEVPDTPQLYFGASCADSDSNGKCDDDSDEEVKSQFYLIGPGIKGQNAENPLEPLEITGPGLKVVDDKIQLVKDEKLGFGFKTQQTYIYKREENDENIQNE